MKLTFLTLLLVLSYSFSISAQEPNPAIKEYHQQLTVHLRNHYDPKIQLNAYFLPFKEINHEKLKLLLSNVINLDSDKYTLHLADNLCHTIKEITLWCQEQNIYDIRQQKDPENLNSYLFELNQLKEDAETNLLLNKAAELSSYSDAFLFQYTQKIAEEIGEFNQLNKKLHKAYISFDINSDDDVIDELVEDMNNSYLYSKQYTREDLHFAMTNSTHFMTAHGFELAYSMPSVRKLTMACKNVINAEACLALSDILIPSKTLLFQNIGFYLKIEAFTMLNKEEKLIKQIELKKQQFMDSLTCYSSTKGLTLVPFFNSELNQTHLRNLSKYGEFIAIKKLAHRIHQIQLENGLVTDFDPKNCEKS